MTVEIIHHNHLKEAELCRDFLAFEGYNSVVVSSTTALDASNGTGLPVVILPGDNHGPKIVGFYNLVDSFKKRGLCRV